MSDVDLSDLDEFTRDSAKHLRGWGASMRRVLKAAAKQEREEHSYQNRTGNLESHTQAVDAVDSKDETTIDLTMDMPYASYVVDRGYSQIDDVAANAMKRVDSLAVSG